jgi:hypothetical protein
MVFTLEETREIELHPTKTSGKKLSLSRGHVNLSFTLKE